VAVGVDGPTASHARPPEVHDPALRREAVFSGWLMTSFESICACQIALMATDLHGVGSHATMRPEVGGGHGCGDHGAMACRGESVRMKIICP
jgi:hypothetical protein